MNYFSHHFSVAVLTVSHTHSLPHSHAHTHTHIFPPCQFSSKQTHQYRHRHIDSLALSSPPPPPPSGLEGHLSFGSNRIYLIMTDTTICHRGEQACVCACVSVCLCVRAHYKERESAQTCHPNLMILCIYFIIKALERWHRAVVVSFIISSECRKTQINTHYLICRQQLTAVLVSVMSLALVHFFLSVFAI